MFPRSRLATARRGLAVALVLALAGSAAAQDLTAYEAMDYNAGNLGGRNGGAGWASPWVGASYDSLVGWWPVDGNANDASPNGFHGVMTDGTYTLEMPPQLIWSTHSLTFTASPRTLFDLSAHAQTIGTMLRGTIATWVKTDKKGPLMVIFGAANSATGDNLQLFIEDGIVKFEVKGNVPTGTLLSGTKDVADDVWHHVAVTVDHTMFVKTFIDGQLDTSGTNAFLGHVIGVDGIWFGRNRTTAGFTRFFQGQLDDLTIWGNVLTDQDIRTLASLPPGLVRGAVSPTGPKLASSSLGSAAFPSNAFGTLGLQPEGNRLSEGGGVPTFRMLTTPLNLQSSSTLYLSCLMRRTGPGAGAAEIRFTDETDVRCKIGWNSQMFFVAGLEQLTPGPIVLPDTTYFVVAKIVATDPDPDQMFVKVYAPGESVTAAEPTAWSIVALPEAHANNLTALWIQPLVTPAPAMEVDEIRLGKSWNSVTSVGYGSGCLGTFIGRSRRPAINSTNYAVHLDGAEPNESAFLSLGLSRTLWGAVALPLNLATIGASGCSVLASREITIPTATDSSGFATVPLSIPNVASLYNRTLFAQWTSLAFGSPNPLKLAFSDGMEILIER